MQKVKGVETVRVSLNEGLTILDLKPDRILFSHGQEIPEPASAIRDFLDAS